MHHLGHLGTHERGNNTSRFSRTLIGVFSSCCNAQPIRGREHHPLLQFCHFSVSLEAPDIVNFLFMVIKLYSSFSVHSPALFSPPLTLHHPLLPFPLFPCFLSSSASFPFSFVNLFPYISSFYTHLPFLFLFFFVHRPFLLRSSCFPLSSCFTSFFRLFTL